MTNCRKRMQKKERDWNAKGTFEREEHRDVAWSVFLVRFLVLVFCRTLLVGFVACVLTVQLLSALLLVSSDPVIMKLIS